MQNTETTELASPVESKPLFSVVIEVEVFDATQHVYP